MRRLVSAWLGAAAIAAGFSLFAFGGAWAPAALELTARLPYGAWLELLLPFLPMAVIGLGVVILLLGGTRRTGT